MHRHRHRFSPYLHTQSEGISLWFAWTPSPRARTAIAVWLVMIGLVVVLSTLFVH